MTKYCWEIKEDLNKSRDILYLRIERLKIIKSQVCPKLLIDSSSLYKYSRVCCWNLQVDSKSLYGNVKGIE